MHLALLALVVRDYDEAIDFYTTRLGFELLEDTDLGNDKRWVRVGPRPRRGAEFLMARAVNAEQISRVGNQTGGRVFLFLETDDFDRDYAALRSKAFNSRQNPGLNHTAKWPCLRISTAIDSISFNPVWIDSAPTFDPWQLAFSQPRSYSYRTKHLAA